MTVKSIVPPMTAGVVWIEQLPCGARCGCAAIPAATIRTDTNVGTARMNRALPRETGIEVEGEGETA